MLDTINTRIAEMRGGQTPEGQAPEEAGLPLTLVKLSDGSTGFEAAKEGGVFGGVSYLRQSPTNFNSASGESVIPDGGVVAMDRLPAAGQISIYIDGSVVPSANIGVDDSAPDAAGKVNIDGFNLYFHADDIGKTQTHIYKYEMTVMEAKQLSGDGPIGGHASVAYNAVQRIVKGQVGTTCFDASADWLGYAGFHLAVNANGFTVPKADGSDAIPGTRIISLPSGEDSILVLELD